MKIIKIGGYLMTLLYCLFCCYGLGFIIDGNFNPYEWETGTLQAMIIVCVMLFIGVILTSHVKKHHKQEHEYEVRNKEYKFKHK